MKRCVVLSFALLLALPVWSLAATEEKIPLSTVIAAVEGPFQAGAAASVAIQDFEAELAQESNIVSLNRIQRAKGRVQVRFERSAAGQVPKALFRCEYLEPTPQEFISDGKTLYAYLPENKQVIESEVPSPGEARNDNPITFLTGLGQLSRDFVVAWAEPNQDADGNFILELSPRQDSPMLKKLLVVISRKAVLAAGQKSRTSDLFPLLSSTVFDPNGNTTRIEFNQVRINQGLPVSLFNFTIPEGVEVMHPSSSGLGH